MRTSVTAKESGSKRGSPARASSRRLRKRPPAKAPAAPTSIVHVHAASSTFARFDLALDALIAGLEVVVRHARRALVKETADRLVEAHRDLRTELRARGTLRGWLGQARLRAAGSKLRWEWLAATGATLDGAPDHRLLSECVVAGERLSEVTEQLARHAAGDQDLCDFVDMARARVRQLLRAAEVQLAQSNAPARVPA